MAFDQLSSQSLAELNTTSESLTVDEIYRLLFHALDTNRIFRFIAAEYMRTTRVRSQRMLTSRMEGVKRVAEEVRQGIRPNMHSPKKAD